MLDIAWSQAVLGGGLIGLAAVLMMAALGRIAGISGILASVLRPASVGQWQWAFLAGLIASGLGVHWFLRPLVIEVQTSSAVLILAGLLVGFGTRLGSGCTSGHGVCGISRLSPRSILATLLFMGAGIATVFLMHIIRGIAS